MAREDQPKDFNPLETISTLAQAAEMVKGGIRARRPEAKAPKDGGKIQKTEGRIGLKSADNARVEVEAPEGAAEWHGEVIDGLKQGMRPPEIKQVADIKAVQESIAAVQSKGEISWLVRNGEVIHNEKVAQIVSDIATSKHKDDFKFLLAKGAQLNYGVDILDLDPQDQIQAAQVLTRIHIHMRQLASKQAIDAQLNQLANEHMMVRGVFSKNASESRSQEQEAEVQGASEAEGPENQVAQEVETAEWAYVKEKLIESARASGGNVEMLQAVRSLTPEAAQILSEHLHKGQSMQDILTQLKDSSSDLNKKLDAASPRDRLRVRAMVAVSLGDTEPVLEGGASYAFWKKKYDGKVSPDLKKQLIKLQNRIDDKHHLFENDPRKIESAYHDLMSFGEKELKKADNPQDELRRMLEQLEAQRRSRGDSITEPFSSLYLDAKKRKQLVINPEFTYMDVYRKLNQKVTFFTEGSISESYESELRLMSSYYANDQYLDDLKELLTDGKYRPFIEAATNTKVEMVKDVNGRDTGEVDLSKLENHPFYQDRKARLKQVSDFISSQENLLRSYGMAKHAPEMQKWAQQVANLGDVGVNRIKANNGHITGLAYHLFDEIGNDAHYGDHGEELRIGDTEIRRVRQQVTDVLRANREALKERYEEYWQKTDTNLKNPNLAPAAAPTKQQIKDAYGGLYKELGLDPQVGEYQLSDEAIDGIVREAELLYTVTLRDIRMIDRGLAPGDAAGQNEQPVQYAAAMGAELALRGRSPMRWLINRWDFLDGPGRLHARVMADEYAKSSGVDKRIDDMVAKAMKNKDYKRKLGEYALSLTELDSESKIRVEAGKLKNHFEFDLQGYKHKAKDIPANIDNLTSDQLAQILRFREGLKYADLILGGYDYEGAGWVAAQKLKQFDRIYGEGYLGRGIGLSDQRRVLGGDLTVAENHEDLHKAQQMLLYGKTLDHGHSPGPDDKGVLGLQAEYMPHKHIQEFVEHHDFESLTQFDSWIESKLFDGVILEKDGEVGGKPVWKFVDVQKGRYDQAIKGVKRVYRMTDEYLSLDGIDPINYANGIAPEQASALAKACDALGVDRDKYLHVMKTFSTYAGNHDRLHKLVEPEYFDTYRMTEDLDAREKFLDTPQSVPGSRYTSEPDGVVKKLSSEIGGHEGKGMNSAIARVTGDGANASDNAQILGLKLLGARDQKVILESLNEFSTKILMTGGKQAAHRGVAIVAGSWAKAAQMDRSKDWLIYGSMLTETATSPFQRVGVSGGDHGDPSMTLNETHEFWINMQKAAKLSLEIDAPEINSNMEASLGLIGKWNVLGFHYHTKAPLYVYRTYLGILIMLGIAGSKAFDKAKEGVKDGFGDSAGGGGAHH
jgi:hypothetical protein